MHFFQLIGGIKVLDSGFFDGESQPRTQAISRYPSYHRRLGTECDFRHATKWAHNIEGIQHSGQSIW